MIMKRGELGYLAIDAGLRLQVRYSQQAPPTPEATVQASTASV